MSMSESWDDGMAYDECGLPLARVAKTVEPRRGYASALTDMEKLCGKIAGVGPDAPIVTAANGAKQSHTPYRCDLLPAKSLLHIANILDAGAKKYGANNWRGLPAEDHINHALVHILAHEAGDTQDDHLGHAACRMLMALETYLNSTGDK